MNKPIAIAAAALFTIVVLSPAESTAQTAETWKGQASIYIYLPDIGGSTTFPQNGSGSNVGLDSSTIIDNLKMTFMGSLEARKGQTGIYTDLVYIDIGNSKSGFRELSIGGAPLPGGANANANFDLKGLAWTIAGTWRVAADPVSTLDIIAGTRLFDMEQTLDWNITGNVGTIPLPGRAGKSTAKLSNWDAIVGLKGRLALGQDRKWFIPYYADIGMGESDFTWQAMGGLGYSFGWGDVVAAWRYLDYEMKPGKKIENMTFNGPAIAAVFHW